MPQKSSQSPKVMTWPQASKTLGMAGIFDALRYFFLMFWFFGPALAAAYCTAQINGAVGTSIATGAGKIVAGGCTLVAGVIGFYGAGITETFGTIMAIAVGFLGWLIITMIIVMTDARTFKENPASILWIFVGLSASVFLMAWRVYARQIKTEKAAYKKWELENAGQIKARNQQIAALNQAREVQFAEEQAANDARYEQEAAQQAEFKQQEAANDAEYDEMQSPEKMGKAA